MFNGCVPLQMLKLARCFAVPLLSAVLHVALGFLQAVEPSIHLLPRLQGDPDKEKGLIIVFNSGLDRDEWAGARPVHKLPEAIQPPESPCVLFQLTQHKEICSQQNAKVASSLLCSTAQGAGGTWLLLKTAIYTEAWIICPGNMSGKVSIGR